MIQTNVLVKLDGRPKLNQGSKWRDILKPIWDKQKLTGKGHQSVVIPSNPIALLDQCDLLMESR